MPLTLNGRANERERGQRRPKKDKLVTGIIIAFSMVAIILCIKVLLFSPSSKDSEKQHTSQEQQPKQLFDSLG